MEDRLRQAHAEAYRQENIVGDVSAIHMRMASIEEESAQLKEENTRLNFETNRWKEDERSLEAGKMKTEV